MDKQSPQPPTLTELGLDLTRTTRMRRLLTLFLPFAAMGSYALFAGLQWWPLAVVSVMSLCFVTYGSTSHDLVHHALGLPPRLNDFMLSLIEVLSLRSGTAYRVAHLHHHGSTLASDDIEGSAAHGSLPSAILNGITLQPRLWHWAYVQHKSMRKKLVLEATVILVLVVAAAIASHWTIAPLVYVGLVIGGSWLFPLITVYIPHDARGHTPLTQTRLFRGRLASIVAMDHLYHLEHHLYRQVPHHHWKALADRLDPYFEQMGIKPMGRNK